MTSPANTLTTCLKTNLDLDCFTGGRKDAIQFLEAWGKYLRAADNIVDEGWYDRAHLLEAFALGCACYSTEFYRKNVASLQTAALLATSLWEQSVHWERQPVLWKRQWADVLRHADITVLSMVALMCGGWESMTQFTKIFLTAAYIDHKDRRGVPE